VFWPTKLSTSTNWKLRHFLRNIGSCPEPRTQRYSTPRQAISSVSRVREVRLIGLPIAVLAMSIPYPSPGCLSYLENRWLLGATVAASVVGGRCSMDVAPPLRVSSLGDSSGDHLCPCLCLRLCCLLRQRYLVSDLDVDVHRCGCGLGSRVQLRLRLRNACQLFAPIVRSSWLNIALYTPPPPPPFVHPSQGKYT